MKTLGLMIVFIAAALAGCSGLATSPGPGAAMSEKDMCEQSRGGGVWMAASGNCFRGGGGA